MPPKKSAPPSAWSQSPSLTSTSPPLTSQPPPISTSLNTSLLQPGATIRVKTTLGETIEGAVFCFDSEMNVVALGKQYARAMGQYIPITELSYACTVLLHLTTFLSL